MRPAGPLLAVLFVAACASQAQALFTLSVNPPSFSLGAMNPGSESVSQTIVCTVDSDIDMPWSITLEATPLVHSDGVTTFPAAHYRYWLTYDYPGTEVPAFSSDAPIPVTAVPVYAAGAGEYVITSGTYGIGFKAVVGAVQKAGSYSSQINLTLVNNF